MVSVRVGPDSADRIVDRRPAGIALRAALKLSIALFAGAVCALLASSEPGQLPRPVLAALVTTALTIGTWPAIGAIGKLADAALPPRSMPERVRIADDPYVGSLGATAIALALLIEYAALINGRTLQPVAIGALPVLAVMCGSVITYTVRRISGRHHWLVGAFVCQAALLVGLFAAVA